MRLDPVEAREPPDLRMPLLALAAWLGALLGQLGSWPAAAGTAAAMLAALPVLARRRGRRAALTAAAVLLVAAAVAWAALVRTEQVTGNPVARLAADGAVATLEATVTSDPRVVPGQYADRILLRLEVRRVTGRGASYSLATPVVVLGDEAWRSVPLGATVRTTGRLSPSDDGDAAAVLGAAGDPVVLADPDLWWRAADRVRSSIRDAVAHRPADQRALVPALVDGDDGGLDPALADDFRATGLTHLLAVSGTNLTLVVGFLLVVCRWVGVRGRWLYLVGAAGICGFVLLARTEPSVVRAAAMGTVGLVGMGVDGRRRGFRALGVAVTVLLLAQPALAVSIGFALSVLATGGILVLAPGWRDALARWLPRSLAEAVAVPAAAQLACTPLVAAISGQVSLVAVATNLLVAPVVGPATVLGLLGGLVGLVSDPLARLLGTLAAWCVAWIVLVARRGADLPAAAMDWGTGVLPLVGLTLLTVVVALVAPRVLRHRSAGLACAATMVLAVAVRLPTPGWPPEDWAVVACDVGQGDALAVRVATGTAIVVDAGPDPSAVDGCLDRLHVTSVPLLVLTHFHADHVDGLAGVLEGRMVGVVETSPVLDPPSGVDVVRDATVAAGVPVRTALAGTRTIGEATVQVLGPVGPVRAGPGDGSAANDASVVLLVEVRGLRVLLTGDLEPPGQAALARSTPGLRVDVLKVPHHGSRHQDLAFLDALGADVALVSVGADNDYGHPAASVLEPLERGGTEVLRTDQGGDVVVGVEGEEVFTRVR
ncbi:ComEC/Rec2 family competence protein [Nocardioides sp. W7]|uniref:ComEC/Rec2 family competence protein n=1 Tax=Nocardioides sp. W7 TaxID=2931390 RepID=UPI001FD0A654|nr:ComEC/Rec2 family competence protein [Nocardioides sp. W7]